MELASHPVVNGTIVNIIESELPQGSPVELVSIAKVGAPIILGETNDYCVYGFVEQNGDVTLDMYGTFKPNMFRVVDTLED